MIRQLATNAAVQLTGKMVSVLLGLAVVALMTRALGPDGYGQYTTIVAFLQLAGILVDLGLTVTAGKLIGEARLPEPVLLGNLLSLRVVTAGVAFAAAPLVALFIPYPPLIRVGIAVISLSFFAASVAQTFGAVFQKYLKTGWFVLAEILGRLVLLALTAWAAAGQLALPAYLWAMVAASIVNMVLVLVFARRLTSFRFRFEFAVWRLLWRETWPVAVTIALNLVYFKADIIILSLYWPAADVGYYGASYKVLEVLLALPTILGGLLLPLVARAVARGERATVSRLYSLGLTTMVAAGLGTIAVSAVAGRELMQWLAGSAFLAAGDILAVVALATAAVFIGNLVGYFILALSRQRQMIPFYAIAAVAGLAGYLVTIPRYSYWGAAWVTVAVEVFMAVASLWLVRRNIQLLPVRWLCLSAVVALFTVFLLATTAWPFFVRMLTGGILYLVLLAAVRLLPPEFLAAIRKSVSPSSP